MTQRTSIREKIKDLIAPHFVRAFDYRPAGMSEADLPAAFVYLEVGETEVDHDDEYMDTALLNIEMTVHGMGNLDAQLDQLADLVNSEFKNNPTVDGAILGIQRSGWTYDPDPETLTNALTLSYQIIYDED